MSWPFYLRLLEKKLSSLYGASAHRCGGQRQEHHLFFVIFLFFTVCLLSIFFFSLFVWLYVINVPLNAADESADYAQINKIVDTQISEKYSYQEGQ